MSDCACTGGTVTYEGEVGPDGRRGTRTRHCRECVAGLLPLVQELDATERRLHRRVAALEAERDTLHAQISGEYGGEVTARPPGVRAANRHRRK